MNHAFLDTSVVVQFLVGEAGEMTSRAANLFERLSDRDEILHISTTVIFETAYVLNGTYGVPRSIVADRLGRFVSLSGVVLQEVEEVVAAFAHLEVQSSLSYADYYHLVLAKSLGLSRIYSFDKKMNRYLGVERVEP